MRISGRVPRAVATRDEPPGKVVAGVPVRVVEDTD